MSYVTMDHADWVRQNIAAVKQHRKPTAAERRRAADGIGWFAAPDELSPDQARIFDILGIVGGGIYNAPIIWESLDWHCGHGMAIVWRGGLASWDFDRLTMLVFLCHEARIRVEIDPHGHQYVKLYLHPRTDAGGMTKRHPNLQEAVDAFRRAVPDNHPIMFRAQPAGEAASALADGDHPV